MEDFSLEILLDSLPQNRILYKDSGLWQVRSDYDMDFVYIDQFPNEPFKNFIIRYIEWLEKYDNDNYQETIKNILIKK